MAGRLGPVVLLVLCGALVYANALDGPFIFDDLHAIRDNPDIRQFWPPGREDHRLLVQWSLALNYALGGLSVTGYHGFNLGVHLLCGVALLGVARRLLARVGLADRAAVLALGGALLWVVHPLNSQVVNYTIQRSESLMALCYLGTLYGFLRGVDGGRGWWILSVVCCGLGMLAKEVMVSAPVAVLVVDGLVVSGGYGAALRRHRGLYGGLALTWGLLWWGLASVPHGQTIGFGRGVAAWTYLLNQAQMLVTYLGLVVWPQPLSLDYGLPRPLGVVDVWWQGLVILALLAGTGWLVYRRRAWGLVGAVFFLVLAPTSSVVPLVNEVGAERRMYVPLMGLLVGWVVGLSWVLGRGRFLGVWLVALLVLGGLTVSGNAAYGSAVSIWGAAARAVPDNPRAHYNLAVELEAIQEAEQAMAHYRQAVALKPDYREAHNNLGKLLTAKGDPAAAIDHYRKVIELDPAFVKTYVNLGIALVALDRMPEALTALRQAVEIEPSSHLARNNLARALEKAGRPREALDHYQWSLGLDPRQTQAPYRMGLIYADEGQWALAAYHVRQALAQAPDWAQAHFHLGRVLGRMDSTAAGIAHYRRAVALDPGLAEGHFNLGTVLMQRGDAAAAVVHLDRVVVLRPDWAEAYNNLGIALRLAGRPGASAAQFRRALLLRPDYADARANLSSVLEAE